MISSGEAFSIFRKWMDEKSAVEFLTGSVADAPTLRPARSLLRVVEVSEPNEIALLPDGRGTRRCCVDLREASFEYADTRETSHPTSGVWVCFIEAKLASGQTFLFGERNCS